MKTENIKLVFDTTDFDDLSVLISKYLVEYINQQIGAKTDLNYRIMPVLNGENSIKINIPLQFHQMNDTDFTNLLNTRINTLKKFLIEYDWNKVNNVYNWCWRVLVNKKIDLFNFARIVYSDIIDEPVEFKLKIEQPMLYEYKQSDGSVVRNIVDPYLLDYGVYVNLSVEFSDMNYGWNTLHMYEHMMTYAWEDLSEKYLTEKNGGTMINGLCYVYTIHNKKESLIEYFREYLKFHIETRKNDKWNKLKLGRIKETKRTISETISEHSLSAMGKSDPSAFGKGYDTKIFQYYSNKPFVMLLMTPERIDVRRETKKFDFNPVEVSKPKDKVYDYIPLSVLRDKNERDFLILKKNKVLKGAYGVDCVAWSENNDLDELNTLLLNKLMLHEINPKKDLKNFNLPLSNLSLNQLPMRVTDVSMYFIGCRNLM